MTDVFCLSQGEVPHSFAVPYSPFLIQDYSNRDSDKFSSHVTILRNKWVFSSLELIQESLANVFSDLFLIIYQKPWNLTSTGQSPPHFHCAAPRSAQYISIENKILTLIVKFDSPS